MALLLLGAIDRRLAARALASRRLSLSAGHCFGARGESWGAEGIKKSRKLIRENSNASKLDKGDATAKFVAVGWVLRIFFSAEAGSRCGVDGSKIQKAADDALLLLFRSAPAPELLFPSHPPVKRAGLVDTPSRCTGGTHVPPGQLERPALDLGSLGWNADSRWTSDAVSFREKTTGETAHHSSKAASLRREYQELSIKTEKRYQQAVVVVIEGIRTWAAVS